MQKHQPTKRYVIQGQWQDGSEFSVDPKWWSESEKKVKTLVARLEKPITREWDEKTNQHREYAKKVAYVEVVEYRNSVVGSYGSLLQPKENPNG